MLGLLDCAKSQSQGGQTFGLDLVRYGFRGLNSIVCRTRSPSLPTQDIISAWKSTILTSNESLCWSAESKIVEARALPLRPRFFARDPFNNLIEFVKVEGDYLANGDCKKCQCQCQCQWETPPA